MPREEQIVEATSRNRRYGSEEDEEEFAGERQEDQSKEESQSKGIHVYCTITITLQAMRANNNTK